MTKVKQVVGDGILPRLIWQRLGVALHPYLITGFHAAFQYHHWLSPTAGLVGLRVYPADLSWWQKHLAVAGIHVSLKPPTRQDVTGEAVVVVLKSDLVPSLHARRQITQGVSYESAEDLCLNMLAQARGESAYAEVAAILVARRETLDWAYLIERAATTGQTMTLGILAEITNHEAGCELIPQEVIERLREQVPPRPTDIFPAHPSRRWTWQQKAKGTETGSYPESSARWRTQVVLPRHVVGKVVFDLRPRWASR